MRGLDWSQTPLGPAESWPQSLRTSVGICLNSAFAILVWWGPELVALYNDAYRPVLGDKHPMALGRPGREVFPEIWDTIGPMLEGVLRNAEAVRADDLLLFLERNGYPEECYFTFSYSPILAEHGGVGGVFTPVQETTERVIDQRRLTTLGRLAELRTSKALNAVAACESLGMGLAENTADIPFLGVYLFASGQEPQPGLATAIGPLPAALHMLPGNAAGQSAFLDSVLRGETTVVPLDTLTTEQPASTWGQPVRECFAVPFGQPGAERPRGFLLSGVNPYKHLDDAYRSFFAQIANHFGSAVAEAEAAEQERRRLEALAEIDRAKTTFFSNISHEFRTPLTLIMGPVQDLLASGSLPEAAHASLALAHRNSLRLQRLVTNLLDFARIEARRMQAYVQPTDLAQLTEDLVSGFRSAYERAGLSLEADLAPSARRPVLVDRDMWEKIVLNLLSNALKFTIQGGVRLELRGVGELTTLLVQDTGIGIAPDQQARVFERFHRVEGAQGRTHEGTGIGLALVQELVKLHNGTISLQSEPGVGSRFTVELPLELASDAPQPGFAEDRPATAMRVEGFVAETLDWTPEDDAHGPEAGDVRELASPSLSSLPALPSLPERADGRPYRILVADDNADMRRYVSRLLRSHLAVDVVRNGAEALAAIRRLRPDLLVSDVMMPVMDGFSLVAAIRSDPATATLPVILMSAKAGQEAELDGLRSGADDYLVKPFSAPELVTRVQSLLKIAAVRTAAEQAIRLSEERVRLALDSAAIGTWDFDPVSHVLHTDDRTRAAFGLSAGNNADFHVFLNALHPDDLERTRAALRAALDPTGPGTYYLEYRTIGVQDGVTRWIVAKGSALFEERNGSRQAVRFLGTVLDVTERKLTELALRESEGRAQRILEQTTDAVFMLSTDWRFTYLNRNAVVSIAAGRDLLGKNVWEEFPDAVDRQFAQQYQRAMREGTPVQFEEFYPEPLNKWFGVHAYPTEEGLAVFFHDITARRRSEAALLQTEKIAAAGRLAASISHEINNPLESITNLLYLMEQDRALTPETRTYVETAQAELSRVSQIATQTLRFYRQSTRASQTDIGDLLNSILQFFKPKLTAAGIALAVQQRPADPVVAFGGELRQVFTNLIGNAIDALGAGGRIAVRSHPARDPRTSREGVRIMIADTGSGMSAATLARIFEPFFTTKGLTGTGLGLWITKELVDKHQGTIRVRSSTGPAYRGTVFLIFVPYLAIPPEKAGEATQP